MNNTSSVVYLPTQRESSAHVVNMLLQYLKDCATSGEIATYKGMEELINRDPRKPKSSLRTALDKALKEYGLLFECVSGVGYKPLKPGAALERAGNAATASIKSTTQRWRSKYDAIDPRNLSQSELKNWIAQGCKLTVYEDACSPRTDRRIQAAMEPIEKSISQSEARKLALDAARSMSSIG